MTDIQMPMVDIHAHPLLARLYLDKQPPPSDPLSLDALTAGRVSAVVSSIYPSWWFTRRSAYMDRCRDILDLIEAHITEHPDRAALVSDAAGLEEATAQGKIAFIHAVEGGHVLEGRLDNLERLYGWGVRSLTLTHFMNSDLAASTFDPRRKLMKHNGLTPFGRDVIAGMNALGMLIDLAHSSEKAFWQVMDLTDQPVLVSHTGVRHFVSWEICASDEQIRALAQNGGLLGIILSAIWLKRFQARAGIEDLVDNILYVCDLVGADHVAIGSDFNGTPPIRGVKTAADFPRIVTRLLEAGLSEPDVEKIMGGNFRRVFKQVALPAPPNKKDTEP